MKKKIFVVIAFCCLAFKLYAQEGVKAVTVTNTYAGVYKNNDQDVASKAVSEVNINSSNDDDAQRNKSFSKAFAIGKADRVNIANMYGSITVKTWDKNEVKIDADIKAYANTDAEAQKLIDDVIISATKNGEEVVFKTQIDNGNGSWGNGSRNGKKWRREVKVAIVMYLPAYVPLTASQQYGALTLDNYSGPTSLTVQYGNLTTGNLNNSNNYIKVQYGRTKLADVKSATVKVQYGGGLTIGNIDEVEIEAQYTAVNIENVKRGAQIKQQYGSGLTIGYVGNLSLTAQYTKVNLGKLAGTFTGKIQYGRLDIDQVEASSKTINVDAQYTQVDLGFAPSFAGDFSVNTSYGSFKYNDNVSARKIGDDKNYSAKKAYTGNIGKGENSSVRVNANYGGVVFN